MKIIHLRDQYLRVSFIYFLLIGFKKYKNELLCREIIESDLEKYPYDFIRKTSPFFNVTWFLDKFATVKLKFNVRLINDWYAYYQLLKSDNDILAIHAHMGTQGFYAIPLVKKLKKPLVVTFYGSDMSDVPKLPGWKERYLQLFKVASKVIVEGPYMKSKLIELGCMPEQVEIVKIGVPLQHLSFQYRPVYKEGEVLQVMMCANFFPKKGYLKALKAFEIMKQNGVKFQVSIIGEGILKQDILNCIIANDLGDIVTLLGAKTLQEIYELSNKMHVFCHPSETAPDGGSEGGAPTIIIEMQALGLPIIATKHADIPNVIPLDNHFLADEYDVNGLVYQFERLTNIRDWNSISERGRDFVILEHSNEKCSGEVELIYEKLGL
jgi:colanic acid/amylovoran biosynthesis glycosyltransferase